MSYKTIQMYCPSHKVNLVTSVLSKSNVIEFHANPCSDNTTHLYLLLSEEYVQPIIDALQNILGDLTLNKMVVMTVEAVVPAPIIESDVQKTPHKPKNKKTTFFGVSREELLDIILKGVKLDRNFILLVIFSTIVAAIGLLENNVAVVIGAMVIAPLLGPVLALAFASSLGDSSMMRQAMKTNFVGFSVCLIIAFLLGAFWPYALDSHELLQRTNVSFDGIILASVSGAAAVLSLTRNISSVMVGVMVAVALLPPATTLGIMLGAGHFSEALGAFLLLAVNIVCLNLSAKVTLMFQGVGPRTWYEQQKAKHATFWSLLIWSLALIILVAVIYIR